MYKPQVPVRAVIKRELKNLKDYFDYETISIDDAIKYFQDLKEEYKEYNVFIEMEDSGYDNCYFKLTTEDPESEESFQKKMDIYNTQLKIWEQSEEEKRVIRESPEYKAWVKIKNKFKDI